MGNRAQWKNAEMRLAKFFGTVRRPLSGGNQSGAADGPRDDGQHPDLYLENKYGIKVAPTALFKDTAAKAKKEGRTPVLGLQQKGEGLMLCFHSRDMETVCRAWAEANDMTLSPKKTDEKTPPSRRKRPLRKIQR